MKRLLSRMEQLLHIGMFLLLMGAFLPLWREKSGFVVDPVNGDPVQRGVLLCGYASMLITLARKPKTALFSLLRRPLVLLLVLWALVSVLWSESPEVSFRKGVAVVLTTLYAVVLVLKFSSWSLIRLLGASLFIVSTSSLVLALALPDWGVMTYPHEGAWRGIFVHKNVLGHVTAFSLLVFGILIMGSRTVVWRLLWGGAFMISLVVLVGSRSATSLVLASVIMLGLMFGRLAALFRRAWPVFWMGVLVVVGTMAVFVVQNYEVILEVLQKDVTLTGRVPLWTTLIGAALNRFWLGYGYGGFWLGWEGPSSVVWATVGWYPSHGHNGYLDLWLELGVVGLVFGALVLLVPLLRLGHSLIYERSTLEQVFLLNLLVYLFAYNFMESAFLKANNLYWALIVYAHLSSSGMGHRREARTHIKRYSLSEGHNRHAT